MVLKLILKLHGQYQLKRNFVLYNVSMYNVQENLISCLNLFYTCIIHPVEQLCTLYVVYISCIVENSIKNL